MVMRKCETIKQSKLQKIKSKILSNLFNEKYIGSSWENLTIQLGLTGLIIITISVNLELAYCSSYFHY